MWIYPLFILFFVFLIGCSAEVEKMKMSSNSFDGKIPSKFTCDGENINPSLSISNVSSEAQSLVLIMDDPDAIKPADKVWDHWIVWNIPVTTTFIEEGKEPEGVHGTGNGGNTYYIGPCPPDKEHRYFFKLYALDITLDLEE